MRVYSVVLNFSLKYITIITFYCDVIKGTNSQLYYQNGKQKGIIGRTDLCVEYAENTTTPILSIGMLFLLILKFTDIELFLYCVFSISIMLKNINAIKAKFLEELIQKTF